MKSTPILYISEMALAEIRGLKSQTRRIIADQPTPPPARAVVHDQMVGLWAWQSPSGKMGIFRPQLFMCPFGIPGDELWGRETFRVVRVQKTDPVEEEIRPVYRADTLEEVHSKWTPSIHMNRKYTRIVRVITDIRVQHLQDISPEDAIAEGCYQRDGYYLGGPHRIAGKGRKMFSDPIQAFRDLWNSIYQGLNDWEGNPWVWALSYKRALGTMQGPN